MIRNKYAAFILYIVFFMVFWNLLDCLYTTFITGGVYQIAARRDLFIPSVVSICTGYLLFLRRD